MSKCACLRVSTARWGKWLILIGLFVIALPCSATMWLQRGINGQAVVHDSRVYFVQADETLTVLDLRSGDVLRRFTERPGMRDALYCDAGLLIRCSGEIAALDWKTLETRWSIAYDQTAIPYIIDVLPGLILINEGLACSAVDSSNGQTLWSVPGYAFDWMIEGNQIMIVSMGEHAPGTTDTWRVCLVDIASGQVLRQHTIETERYISRRFLLDGSELYAFDDMNFENECAISRIEQDGALTDVSDDPVVDLIREGHYLYVRIGERAFDTYGRVIDMEKMRPWREGEPILFYEQDGVSLYDGFQDAASRHETRILIDDHGIELRLIMPHAGGGRPFITATDDEYLFATGEGTVECIERATGQSRWLYVSNWNFGLVSYTGGTLVDWHAMVRDFDQQAGSIDKRTPSLLLPAGKPWSRGEAIASQAPVIEDPSPTDPYEDLRAFMKVMGVLPFLIAGLMVGCWVLLRKRQERERWLALASALLFSTIVLLLGFFFAVSILGTFVWLAEACLLIAATVFFSVRSLQLKQGVITPIASGVLVIGCLCWSWPMSRYVPWLIDTYLL